MKQISTFCLGFGRDSVLYGTVASFDEVVPYEWFYHDSHQDCTIFKIHLSMLGV